MLCIIGCTHSYLSWRLHQHNVREEIWSRRHNCRQDQRVSLQLLTLHRFRISNKENGRWKHERINHAATHLHPMLVLIYFITTFLFFRDLFVTSVQSSNVAWRSTISRRQFRQIKWLLVLPTLLLLDCLFYLIRHHSKNFIKSLYVCASGHQKNW